MFVKGLDTPFPKSCLHGAGGNLFVLRVVFLAHDLAKPVSLAAFLFGLQQVGAWPSHWQDPRQGMANDVVIRFLMFLHEEVIHRPRKGLRAKDDHSRVIGICNRKFEPPGLLESLSMFAGPW